jgi:hypothetical protein
MGLGLLAAVGTALDAWGLTHDIGPFALLFADGGTTWGLALCGLVVVAAIGSVVSARRFWPGVGAGTMVGLITMLTYLVTLSVATLNFGPPSYISLGDYAWFVLIFYGLPVVAAAALAAVVSGMTRLGFRLLERPVERLHVPSR